MGPLVRADRRAHRRDLAEGPDRQAAGAGRVHRARRRAALLLVRALPVPAVLREIIESAKKGGVSERDLIEKYRVATGEQLSSKEITKQVVALGGDVDLERAAEGIRYRFPDLELEARAVEAEREAASEEEAKVGKIVFSSED